MLNSRYMPHRVVRGIGRRLYSPVSRSVVLRRDLERSLVTPRTKIPIAVRAADDGDGPRISALLSELSGYEGSTRKRFLDRGIGTCYVAVNEQGDIC
jgi:hypothetical protein